MWKNLNDKKRRNLIKIHGGKCKILQKLKNEKKKMSKFRIKPELKNRRIIKRNYCGKKFRIFQKMQNKCRIKTKLGK